MAKDDPRRLAFLRVVGADIRTLREAAEMPQQQIADMFGWQRDAVSKIETGKNNLSLYDYLQIVRWLGEMEPNHPALALAARYLPARP